MLICFVYMCVYSICTIHTLHYFTVVVIFGEDVAFGGVFRCTVGLKDKYGKY